MAYASKYYDPVKRHEYYMKHRKLKGRKKKTAAEKALAKRKSLKGLNDYGRAAAAEVKEQIKEERKAAYKAITAAINEKLKGLRAQWKAQGLSKEEIKEKAKAVREQAKTARLAVKKLFEEKYLHELDQIKADPSMRGKSG